MNLLRLHPSQPEGWALWPVFERRVTEFHARVTRETLPPDFMRWLRDSFVNRPEILGAWLAIEDVQPVAHLLAWADVYFGEPFVFVNQVEADAGVSVRAVHAPMIQALRDWVDQMNWAYAQGHSSLRIRKLRFTTERAATIWQRVLAPLGEVGTTRSIITVAVPVEEPVETLVLPPFASVNGAEA